MTRPNLLSVLLYIILLEGWLAAIWVKYGLLAAVAAFVGYGVAVALPLPLIRAGRGL